jgi:hypothetical protein
VFCEKHACKDIIKVGGKKVVPFYSTVAGFPTATSGFLSIAFDAADLFHDT